MIPVTKPFLPPQEEYTRYVNGIWNRNWLTNNGPLVNEIELRLKEYLGLKHLLYVGNGTIALQLAIKALNLVGKEIITTPFSYVATTSSIVWEGYKPVFADIDPLTLTINPLEIENKITSSTAAILATHVYGNACDIHAIDKIAKRHKLKVIYDAAHCFGSKYDGRSVFDFGDISTASFHATKIFHTIEGGSVCSNDPDLIKRVSYMRNFGHSGPEDFAGLGINGKNSEFHAAMGLVNLKYIDEILRKRKELSLYYDQVLSNLEVSKPKINDKCSFNFAYYPIIFKSEMDLAKSFERLNRAEIFPRRYFYPSLSQLPYVERENLPVTDDLSKRVLCLPLYHTLSFEEIDLIARLLMRIQNHGV
ncbi:DegT/DnrJ/EryC1/StrS family aminotransferase [Fulvivirga lutimaris]|uniref:DegT/DnrJ/EryC1/StrS family aminotransferase n=1 Tax=Fulvivirga lutimaris TaxID=1819566 RepID=UPI0012BB65C6|nr:DegT/DnrJ/EryC1/StrS family aminotransferase [Fulvivirga lutimaris]MTI38305.1 DegT/DnrJ/EryC1/StrS family aminotransferase [Fulvivirga lutimaris]